MFEVRKRTTDNGGVTWSSGAIMKQSVYGDVRPVVPREDIRRFEDHVLRMSCDCAHETYRKAKIMLLTGKRTALKKIQAGMECPGRRVSSAGAVRH
jgi:hypothetical protein